MPKLSGLKIPKRQGTLTQLGNINPSIKVENFRWIIEESKRLRYSKSSVIGIILDNCIDKIRELRNQNTEVG